LPWLWWLPTFPRGTLCAWIPSSLCGMNDCRHGLSVRRYSAAPHQPLHRLEVLTYCGNWQSLDVPVTLTIPQPTTGLRPFLGSVLNAASNSQGAIAPGEIIAIRGIALNSFGPPSGRLLLHFGQLWSRANLPERNPGNHQWQVRASALHVVIPDQRHRSVRNRGAARSHCASPLLWSLASLEHSRRAAAPVIFTLDST